MTVVEHNVWSWNAKVLMPWFLVARGLNRRKGAHVIGMQESHRRRAKLAAWCAANGYRLHMPRGLPDQPRAWRVAAGGNPVLVRDDLPQEALAPLRHDETWRRRRRPGTHPPRTSTRVRVEGVEYVCTHLPERFPPALNARVQLLRDLAALLADGKPRVVFGDWNGKPGEVGPGLPGSLIGPLGLKVARTGLIDFFAGQGVQFEDTDVSPTTEGSDHRPVTTDVVASTLPEEPDMLTDADKAWIATTVQASVATELAAKTLDVGKPNPWSDDKVAEVLLSTVGRLEAAAGRIETALATLQPPADS